MLERSFPSYSMDHLIVVLIQIQAYILSTSYGLSYMYLLAVCESPFIEMAALWRFIIGYYREWYINAN